VHGAIVIRCEIARASLLRACVPATTGRCRSPPRSAARTSGTSECRQG
jgi:hypothetical protein